MTKTNSKHKQKSEFQIFGEWAIKTSFNFIPILVLLITWVANDNFNPFDIFMETIIVIGMVICVTSISTKEFLPKNDYPTGIYIPHYLLLIALVALTLFLYISLVNRIDCCDCTDTCENNSTIIFIIFVTLLVVLICSYYIYRCIQMEIKPQVLNMIKMYQGSGTADSGTADSGTADSGTADSGTADSGTVKSRSESPAEEMRRYIDIIEKYS